MGNSPRILVVDDDTGMRHLICMRLGAAGFETLEADSGEMALAEFRQHRPHLVITDLRMGEMDGLALFEHLQKEAPTLPVIVLTAHGTIPDAIDATKRGVFSFLTKPFDGKELLRRVAEAIRLSPAPESEAGGANIGSFLTGCVVMEEVVRRACRLARETKPILLIGPDGVGKRRLAELIHREGSLAAGPFVTFSCTEYGATELDDFLLQDHPESLLDQADGGTLYLQDIGALPLTGQSRLYSFLLQQMKDKDPLFLMAAQAKPATTCPRVRIIASTPRPLDIALADGSFRSDLYYLLNASTLHLPPLAERREEIPLMARHFLAGIHPEADFTLAPEALSALVDANWPGNLRQLRSVLMQAAGMSLTPVIPETLVRRVLSECEEDCLVALDDARRDFERDYLTRLLRATAGNVAQAARVAQRNRTEFYKLLARHELDPGNFKQKFR